MISAQEVSSLHFSPWMTGLGDVCDQGDFEDFDDVRLTPQRISAFLGHAHSLRTDGCVPQTV